MLDTFIAHVNATRTWTRLDEIPAGKVRPHMFRKTMAMLTDQFPGSEIALGIQLKHVATRALANRSTQATPPPMSPGPSTSTRPSTQPGFGAWKTSTPRTNR